MVDIDSIYQKGNSFLKENKNEDALVLFEKVISLDSSYNKAWINKGIALINMKKYDDAIICFDFALEQNSDDFNAWYNKAVLLRLLKKNNDALLCFDKSIELNPKDFEALFNKGILLMELGRNEEAVLYFKDTNQINPFFADKIFEDGNLYYDQKKYELAIDCFKKVIALNSDNYGAWYNMANAIFKSRNYVEAKKLPKELILSVDTGTDENTLFGFDDKIEEFCSKDTDERWIESFILRFEHWFNPNFRNFATVVNEVIKNDSIYSDTIRKSGTWQLGYEMPPKVLWKYRSYNDFTKSILSELKIWIPHVDDLDDIFEFTHDIKINILNQIEKSTNGISLKEEMGVYSLSTINHSELMWTHYADNHKGICIGFNTEWLWNDCKAFICPVIYSDNLHEVDYNETTFVMEFLLQALTSMKLKKWNYQNEIRFILKNKFRINVKIRPESINSIVFGCKIDECIIAEVKELLGKYNWINYYKTQPNNNHKEMEIIRI